MEETKLFLKNGTFTTKKYHRLLYATIASWIVALFNNSADAFFAGAFLNEAAVSAIALVQPVQSVVSFLSYMVSVGTTIMFSRACGAFDKEKGYRYVGLGTICSVVISVILVIALIWARDSVMSFYGASGEITTLAKEYYMCEIFYAAVYPLYYLVFQLVAIDGDALCCLISCITSAIANIVASYLMVGTYGVRGLAYGTIIGLAIAFATYGIHFFGKTNSIHIKLYFNIRDILEMVRISSSSSLSLLYVAIVGVAMNKFVIDVFGDAYLPAYAVINLIITLAAVYVSLFDSALGFVSVSYGENNPAGIRQTMKIVGKAGVILSLVMLIILEVAAPYIPGIYGITDPTVYEESEYAAKMIALAAPTFAAYYVLCGYYSAVEHVLLGNLISAVYMLISPVMLAMPLGLLFGFKAMSIGFMLTSVIAVLFALIAVRIKYGKKAVPLILEDTDEEFISYEMYITDKSVTSLCERVLEDLRARGIKSQITNEIQLMLEESYMTIMEMNGDKKVMTECDILVSDKSIRLITRDNGRIFDITDANSKVRDLRSYMLARLMESNKERSNTTTISFNRNIYLWQLE